MGCNCQKNVKQGPGNEMKMGYTPDGILNDDVTPIGSTIVGKCLDPDQIFKKHLTAMGIHKYDGSSMQSLEFKALQTINLAQKAQLESLMIGQLTMNDFEDGMSPYGNLEPDDGPLEKIHLINQAYNIEAPDQSVFAILNDIECMRIGIRIELRVSGKNRSPILYLPSVGARIDLDTYVAEIEGFEYNFRLCQSTQNDRRRSGFSLSDCIEFYIMEDEKELGAFGQLWAQMYKGDKDALPSCKDILMGIYNYICEQTRIQMQNSNYGDPDIINEEFKEVFRYFQDLVGSQFDVPLSKEELE